MDIYLNQLLPGLLDGLRSDIHQLAWISRKANGCTIHLRDRIFIKICLTHLQALARLRFSTTVAQSDVDEALRLMQMSKFSLYSDERQKSGLDAISDIYSILRDEAARANKMDVSYAHALNWISRKVGLKKLCYKKNQLHWLWNCY